MNTASTARRPQPAARSGICVPPPQSNSRSRPSWRTSRLESQRAGSGIVPPSPSKYTSSISPAYSWTPPGCSCAAACPSLCPYTFAPTMETAPPAGQRVQESAMLNYYDVELSPEVRLTQETIRAFMDREVIPLMAAAFEEGRFPTQLIPRLAELGVLGAD